MSKVSPQVRKHLWVFAALIILAAGFRVAVVHWLPNDSADDGLAYAQIARNVLEQHVYSHATEAPFDPSYVRLPGYPLFLATIYSVFGHTNNSAVRIAQALIDAGTCVWSRGSPSSGNRMNVARSRRQSQLWRSPPSIPSPRFTRRRFSPKCPRLSCWWQPACGDDRISV